MKIYIAGIDGMIGSTCYKLLSKNYDVIGTSYSNLDLLNYDSVYTYLKDNEPDLILIAAAKVGGGHAISNNPVEFLEDNIQIQINLMRAANKLNIKKLIFIASAAIYPENAVNPIQESSIMEGQLDVIQEAYGLAKLVGYYQAKYYNKEYNCKYITVVPANVIGNRDNGQVVYSLIKQMNIAKKELNPSVTLWGSGNQRREFIFVDELAQAIKLLIDKYSTLKYDMYNLGVGEDISIKELAYLIKDISGYKGELIFDKTKPEGVAKRILDCRRICDLGFKNQLNFKKELIKIQDEFLKNQI